MKVWDILIKDGEPTFKVDEKMLSPDSWLEDGIRHAVVYGGDLLPDKLILQKFAGHWLVVEDRILF